MIREVWGEDILKTDCTSLVNPVNCVGAMGAGLAKSVSQSFPGACRRYLEACKGRLLEPGMLVVDEIALDDLAAHETNAAWVIHVATKYHWRDKSKMEWIDKGIENLIKEVKWGALSVAIPPLGCGLGGLDWDEVKPRLLKALRPITWAEFVIYNPA